MEVVIILIDLQAAAHDEDVKGGRKCIDKVKTALYYNSVPRLRYLCPYKSKSKS